MIVIARVSCLQVSIYLNFCCFKALQLYSIFNFIRRRSIQQQKRIREKRDRDRKRI